MPASIRALMGTTPRSLPLYHETPPPRGDLTRAPVLGRFLRWKHARTAVQIPLLVLAAIVVADGLLGPRTSPQNAAGVAPWVQWRGLVVLGLLVFGNLFCMACPFMLPRRLAKRILPADRTWPSWLRAKWLALALLVLFFWGYEALDLWDSPWLTAWLVLAYFAAAFVVDGFFKGAAFCKYACPIGSFNSVNSLASPGEVRVRDSTVCESCETKDCIAGRRQIDARTGREREVQSGCELWLFQPRKVGNLDCTFCLDCVQACPYENVGVMARVPGRELVRDPWRSGIGRLTQRPDVVALCTAVVFAAFLNAAGMIEPMASVRSSIGAVLGTGSEAVIWAAVVILGLGAAPILLLAGAAALSRWLAGPSVASAQIAFRMAFGLVPVGFGMWVAHYAFHMLASGLNLVPVLHRGAVDLGVATGPPDWSLGPIAPPDWLLPLELIALEAGLLGSLVLLYYISRASYRTARTARRAFVPWAVLALGLAGAGAWIMAQPMAMRGMMMPGTEQTPGMEEMSATEIMHGVDPGPGAEPPGAAPEAHARIASPSGDSVGGGAGGRAPGG